MTETTPDYAGLIESLDHRASTMNGADPVGAGEGHTYVTGYYTVSDRMLDREAATALRALLERNAALERERGQLLDKLHCMCGSPIDHSAWEGHTPVSVYDYSLDQAEAKLAEAMKVIARLASYIQSPLRVSQDEDEQNRRDVLIRAARKFLKENGNG